MSRGLKVALLLAVSMIFGSNSYGQLKRSRPLTNPSYDLGRRMHFGFSLGINNMDAEIDFFEFPSKPGQGGQESKVIEGGRP